MSTQFKTVSWLKGASIYEVNIRQFTAEGTINAFAKHLPRLREMGVDILWFMPLTPISLKGRKGSLGSYYACSNYMDINPEFGAVADFKDLVTRAHELGFKVIIDWVANHTGLDHQWTQHPDWYLRDGDGNFIETHGWEDVIDLNYDNAEMQSAMIHAMKYWIGMFDIDGFRCDMAHLVPLAFWQKARRECEQLKQLLFLGECDDDSYRSVFDITYGWRWMHDTEKLRHTHELPATLLQIQQTLNHYRNLPAGSEKLYFTTNHDENSWNGTEYEKYGALASTLAAFTFLYPAVPLIYSGQEIPNLKRLQFFDKDQLNWDQAAELTTFYATFIGLHRLPAFDFAAKLQWLQVKGEDTRSGFNNGGLAYFLHTGSASNTPMIAGSSALVILNFSTRDSLLFNLAEQIQASFLSGTFTQLDQRLQPESGHRIAPDQSWVLPPGGILLYYNE